MANNYKARPTSLLSIANTTHQQKLKANAAITNELNGMVFYLLSVYQNPDLKDSQRMIAVKHLFEIKKMLDSEHQTEMNVEREKAQEEAAQARAAERELQPVIVDTPESIAAALANARRLFEQIQEEQQL